MKRRDFLKNTGTVLAASPFMNWPAPGMIIDATDDFATHAVFCAGMESAPASSSISPKVSCEGTRSEYSLMIALASSLNEVP